MARKKNSNGKNEGIGIASIIIIIALAALGIYYFSHSGMLITKEGNIKNVPVEVPGPTPDSPNQ